MTLPDNLPRPEDDGGTDHLTGLQMPGLALAATSGGRVDLSTLQGRTVVYAYPMTGVPNVELPPGWNDIPGARGCTPQTLAFQAKNDVFGMLGVKVFGLSTQTPDYQKELSDRLGLPFPILSDSEFKLSDALRFPSMVVKEMRLLKRLTLVVNNGTIEHVFYPVFPPNQAAADVIAWLWDNPASGTTGDTSGILIYTTANSPFCKAAKDLLTGKSLPFTEINVDRDAEAAKAMVVRSRGRTTVPQIFIGQTHIGGADDLQALDQSGSLAALVAG